MGLLSGIGQVLAGGVAGGAKAAGESFVEQAKQQALAAREENMLRIQNLFAKAGRKETQKFQAGESKLGRTSQENLAKTRATHELGMAETERKFRTDMQVETNKLALARDKASDEDARARIELQYDNTVKVQKLANEAPGVTAKLAADLKGMGLAQEKVMEYVAYGLSGEKQDKVAYATIFSSLLRTKTEAAKAAGTSVTPEEIKATSEEAALASGWTPPQRGKPAAAPGESAFARAKREKAGKNGGTVQPAPDVNPVLDVNPVPTARPGLLQDPAAAFEGPARDTALSQRNAAKIADYDRKADALRAQGREKDILRLLGPRPI